MRPANRHRPDVKDVIITDEKVPAKDITVWIDPLDATKEYTGTQHASEKEKMSFFFTPIFFLQ